MKKVIIAIIAILVVAGAGIGGMYLGADQGYTAGFEDGLNDAFDIFETAEEEGSIAIINLENLPTI